MCPRLRRATGFTLIEVTIALAVLLVALIGLMRLQVIGFGANQASRSQTVAVQLARELAGGLEQLDWTDAHVQSTGTGSPPSPFGALLSGGTVAPSGFRAWTDSSPVPGVRLDAAITDRDADGTPTYKRRWTVWDYAPTGGTSAAKIIAVSVVFHERATALMYEVVYYTQLPNMGATFVNASALN